MFPGKANDQLLTYRTQRMARLCTPRKMGRGVSGGPLGATFLPSNWEEGSPTPTRYR
jgi:hypothetical protein